jgi:hypothetical protein
LKQSQGLHFAANTMAENNEPGKSSKRPENEAPFTAEAVYLP